VHDRRDPAEVSDEDIAAIADALRKWEAGRVRRPKQAPPKSWHRQPQPAVRESLGELLARADRPEPAPLDCSGWESQIYDGDREGKLALE
jgi:hypothetical protein